MVNILRHAAALGSSKGERAEAAEACRVLVDYGLKEIVSLISINRDAIGIMAVFSLGI